MSRRIGRPPLFGRAMTGAERQRRYPQRHPVVDKLPMRALAADGTFAGHDDDALSLAAAIGAELERLGRER